MIYGTRWWRGISSKTARCSAQNWPRKKRNAVTTAMPDNLTKFGFLVTFSTTRLNTVFLFCITHATLPNRSLNTDNDDCKINRVFETKRIITVENVCCTQIWGARATYNCFTTLYGCCFMAPSDSKELLSFILIVRTCESESL